MFASWAGLASKRVEGGIVDTGPALLEDSLSVSKALHFNWSSAHSSCKHSPLRGSKPKADQHYQYMSR